ncbi:MAG: serine/threonine protein kinase [Marmoricola sp.]|nr:serine/threonine protein kinase [Marmoricola sp.]
MTADPTVDHRSPDRVGPYRLMTRIGEGGMGVVHLAQGPDGRRVALKVLRPHVVGDAEARERLAREVSSLRLVTSPRVAEILDADPHGPTPYVVTRYVPGLSLYHHVAEEGPIAGRDLVHFAHGLAEALEAVHVVGVLHRDVKPTNVVMEGRSPVLIDFGLARVAEDPRLTQTGFLLGTPGYLAPEILYGEDATPASDVHAWAATVVFAATGRAPYGRGPAMAVMDRVRRGEHDLTGVPDDLAGVLAECLQPEPWQRPTLREVRAALPPRVARSAGERELWTRPVRPVASLDPGDGQTPQTRIAPLHAPSPVPAAPVAPPVPAPDPVAATTREPVQPTVRVLPPPAPGALERPGLQRGLQLLGLGALAGAVVAYAPYAGTVLVGLVVLVLRTLSVARQRHTRRRLVRGRARWYDVPTTTVSFPVYLLLALVGSAALVLGAAFVALAMYSLGYVLGQSAEVSLVLAGLGFVPALWWGPGSGRLRETTRSIVTRTARTEFGGWFVVVAGVLGAAVLLTLLFQSGPNWAPALSAPWHALR